MNILYIASLQRFPGHHAGYAHAMNICKGMKGLGHDVHILARADESHPGGSSDEIEGLPVAYVRWPLKFRNWAGTFLSSRSDFKGFIREWDIDIVHERFEMPFAVCTFHAKRAGFPHVLEANSPFVEEFYSPGHPLFRVTSLLRRMQFKRTRRIIVQTPLLRRMLKPVSDTPMEVIPNGADPQMFTPGEASPGEGAALRQRYGIGESDRVIGFSGSFRYWHGAQDLIAAMEKMEHKDARLLLMGGGNNLDEMRELARRCPASERIVFTGPLDHVEIPAHLRLCDVLVAPFNTQADPLTREVFARHGMWWSPLKIFEYMAVGRPVVASGLGMIPEYLKAEEKEEEEEKPAAAAAAGITYPEGDVKALSETIGRILGNPVEARRLGKNGRKRALELYTWEKQARRTVEVYEKVLRSQSSWQSP